MPAAKIIAMTTRHGDRHHRNGFSTNRRSTSNPIAAGLSKKDVTYIDLCDDSDDEDTIIVQQRIRNPLSNVSRNDLSIRPAAQDVGGPQRPKRPASAVLSSAPSTSTKKLRLGTNQEHEIWPNGDVKFSPPRSPPPVEGYQCPAPMGPIIVKAPRSRSIPSTKPQKRVGPFMIDSDSDTEDDSPQRTASTLATLRPQSQTASPVKLFADMAQDDRQKWLYQLQALAKTNPELARRLILQRKARLQTNVRLESPSPTKQDDSINLNAGKLGDQKPGAGDKSSVSLASSHRPPQCSPGLKIVQETQHSNNDPQAYGKPGLHVPLQSRTQVAFGASVPQNESVGTLAPNPISLHSGSGLGTVRQTVSGANPERARQQGTLSQTSVTLSAMSYPSTIQPPESQNSRSVTSSLFNVEHQASKPPGKQVELSASTDDRYEATCRVSSVDERDISGATASLRKAKGDHTTQDMQKLIRDSAEAQDRKHEADKAERKKRWDEEQERRKLAYEKYMKQTAAEESAIKQQVASIGAAAGGKTEKLLDVVKKDQTERVVKTATSECIRTIDVVQEQEKGKGMSAQEKAKTIAKHELLNGNRSDPWRGQQCLSNTASRQGTPYEPAVPRTDTSPSSFSSPRPSATSDTARRDPRKRRPNDVSSYNDSTAHHPSEDRANLAPNIPTVRASDPKAGHSHTIDGFSANSINGQVKLGQSSVPTKANPFGSQSKASHNSGAKTSNAASSQRRAKSASRFGELTFGDVKLYKRKQGQMQWKDLIAFYAQDTGLNRTEKHLRKRWQDMCNIIAEHHVDPDLISKAALGDEDVLSNLNRIIHGHEMEADANVESVSQLIVPSQSGNSSNRCEANEKGQKQNVAPESNTTAASWELPQPQDRPVYGGKVVSLDAQIAYLQSLRDEDVELDEASVKTEEIDPVEEGDHDVTEEDYERFSYSIVRREWTAEDSEDGYETIDDKPWLEYGRTFDHLPDANQAVTRDAFTAQPGGPVIADPDLAFTMEHRKDAADGTLCIRVRSAVGVTETRAERRLRDPRIRTLPHTRHHDLTSRRTYLVLERRSTLEPVDANLLEPPRRVDHTALLDRTTHTTLRGANAHAITRWLQTTFKPSSRNLNTRELEIEAQREMLCIEFDVEGDGLPFRKTLAGGGDGDDDDDAAEYELWVEEGHLAGPRNL
nr:hypothetical protein CFP56_54475 [Quercus suber]